MPVFVTTEQWSQLAVIAAVASSHMSLPNHWLPYSLVGRAHGWKLTSILGLTFLGALGHVLNTILLTLAISGLSGTFFSEEVYRRLSSLSLLIFGLYYLYTYFIARRRESCCEPNTNGSASSLATSARPNDPPAVHRAAAGSLLLLTSLSPCVGTMPVLVSVLAPPVTVTTVIAAGGTMLCTSAAVMMLLVAVSYAGSKTLDFAKVRRHERCILGVSLIVLACLTFFVFSHHHHHHHHDHGHEMASVSHSSSDHASAAHQGHDMPVSNHKGKYEGHDCEHDNVYGHRNSDGNMLGHANRVHSAR